MPLSVNRLTCQVVGWMLSDNSASFFTISSIKCGTLSLFKIKNTKIEYRWQFITIRSEPSSNMYRYHGNIRKLRMCMTKFGDRKTNAIAWPGLVEDSWMSCHDEEMWEKTRCNQPVHLNTGLLLLRRCSHSTSLPFPQRIQTTGLSKTTFLYTLLKGNIA